MQVVRITCCLNMILNLKILKLSLDLFDIYLKIFGAPTDHYIDVKHVVTLQKRYIVR